ncbi:MAG TPA: DUF4249 domain-containing protein [Bacteroidia bacterium]|nr:DUF4249 domain-containing protein [Bacteroidia bacterium]
MKKIFIILPLFLVALVSCEQDANVDIPETDPQLAITCFITPQDSFIRASVTRSNPVFGSSTNVTGDPVTNATVILYGNSSSVTLIYNSSSQLYEIPVSVFPIVGGSEYRLVITEPGGLHAEAHTTVPSTPPASFQCTAQDTFFSNDPIYQEGEVRFDYSFSDPAGQADFYRFITYNVLLYPWSGDTVVQRGGWSHFTDANADGTVISNHHTTGFYTSGDSLIGYEVWMMHANYDYYTFHQSLYNYSDGDPFSEPTMIYSNITDGLGIFAAANSVHMRIPR